ncbi:unnamed protein product [Medioppia subpectinata]|uniref:Peptidase S1 domain-containing protein n=1 Tax=Medioppia subpectinata TaxID=1979941 RepID=A0A7R9KJB6_9ACAR|nr:unnamed protein product [Medioppia subpectinata]CAG2104444.1 unnamed protein product [Medioppia subpectinata]
MGGRGRAAERWILYPSIQTRKELDIALIKLKHPLDLRPVLPPGSSGQPQRPNLASACLPGPGVDDINYGAYALIAGYGRTGAQPLVYARLRIGWMRVSDRPNNGHCHMIRAGRPHHTLPANCHGDSGGPLIQYTRSGRAVLIGVIEVLSTNGVVHSSGDLVIGNYPNITGGECGIGGPIRPTTDQCFTYHKSNDILSNIMNGREAVKGELPWIAYLVINGVDQTGTRVSNTTEVIVHVGEIDEEQLSTSGWAAERWINYPSKNLVHQLDIALIKLQHPLDLSPVATRSSGEPVRPNVAAACLPGLDMDDINYGAYALIAGYGMTGPVQQMWDRLHIGWMRVRVRQYNSHCHVIYTARPNHTLPTVCHGDSGGPLVQYTRSGRAVLIGVTQSFLGVVCETTTEGVFIRVSSFMWWIQNTIMANDRSQPPTCFSNIQPL